MPKILSSCFTLLTCALITACTGINLYSDESKEQINRLESAIGQCTSSHAENQQLLKSQLEQLELQGRRLDDISEAQAGTVERVGAASDYATNGSELSNCLSPDGSPSKLTVGRREQVWLEDIQLAVPARVDTGAETASLDAHNIEMFERNGKRWVRFEILHPESGEALQLERRLKRIVSVIQSNTSEPERRPVIKLGITMGHITQSAEFTLSNRSHLDYQMLIGRNILQDVMIVDVSKINVAPPVEAQQ